MMSFPSFKGSNAQNIQPTVVQTKAQSYIQRLMLIVLSVIIYKVVFKNRLNL